MILTSLEFDHADIFASVEKIEDEFRHVIPGMRSSLIFNEDYPSAMKLYHDYHGKNKDQNWFLYGDHAQLGPHDVNTFENGSSFSLNWKGEKVHFQSSVVGQHNVLNLASCLIFLLSEGFKVEDVQKAAKELEMVKRRQEVRGRYKGMTVIDDFAHHPRAITVTTDAIRARFKNKKIITIFEPISATARSSIFQNEFRDSLASSDKVIIAKAELSTTALNGKDLDADLLSKEINQKGRHSVCVSRLEDLQKAIDDFAEEGAVLLVLSNRTCLGLWESNFVKELKS
jgi:UDP-N-acetylmuramate: L-alanyl-gamma-D-glutamyl-meso-diaminopimelate ligase